MKSHLLLVALCSVSFSGTSFAVDYFQSFDAPASSSDFTVVDANAAVAGTNLIEFGADYPDAAIPEAPNTPVGASQKKGVVLGVNLLAATPAISTINAFCNTVPGSGTYRYQVDVYPYKVSATGTTEWFFAGVAHSGSKNTYVDGNGATTSGSDGYFLTLGSDGDWYGLGFYQGAADLNYDLPGVTWADGTVNKTDRTYGEAWVKDTALPTGGYLANKWATMTYLVNPDAGEVSIYRDNVLLVSYTDSAKTYTFGKCMIGAEDAYTSVNSQDRYIFDNIRIQNVAAGVTDSFLY